MVKKIVLGVLLTILVIVIVLGVVVAIQPADFKIERKITIAAPPEAVFPHVNDFHKWQAWSPWEKLDPTMKRTFEGAEAGTGAIYGWKGDEVGVGKMTILESKPNEHIKIKLEFLEPWQATNTTDFAFKPNEKGTEVTWSMSGTNNFMFKAVHLFMNMEKMVGADFEKGLASMKEVAEKK